jgi:hypothetical protein
MKDNELLVMLARGNDLEALKKVLETGGISDYGIYVALLIAIPRNNIRAIKVILKSARCSKKTIEDFVLYINNKDKKCKSKINLFIKNNFCLSKEVLKHLILDADLRYLTEYRRVQEEGNIQEHAKDKIFINNIDEYFGTQILINTHIIKFFSHTFIYYLRTCNEYLAILVFKYLDPTELPKVYKAIMGAEKPKKKVAEEEKKKVIPGKKSCEDPDKENDMEDEDGNDDDDNFGGGDNNKSTDQKLSNNGSHEEKWGDKYRIDENGDHIYKMEEEEMELQADKVLEVISIEIQCIPEKLVGSNNIDAGEMVEPMSILLMGMSGEVGIPVLYMEA